MYNKKDHYWKKAKQQGYRSRAAFKLLEIQKRYRIFQKGQTVLDLGAAPGGWLQVIAEHVGPRGSVVGVDRQKIDPLPFQQVKLIQGDITQPHLREALREAGALAVGVSGSGPTVFGVFGGEREAGSALGRLGAPVWARVARTPESR